MRIITSAIFEFLKLLSKIALWVYYKPTVVINKDKINISNPAIIVSNHPNTMMDPLNVGIRLKRQIFFLANSGMFASRIGNFFFSNVHCIPIQRKSDKHAINNKDSFTKAEDFLMGGGLLFVAIEGGSEVGRRLRPLKSGTARIALSTEKRNNYQLGLKIIPSAVTYEAANCFRTGTVVCGGEPINVSDYKDLNEEDNFAAAHELTQEIRRRMLPLLIHTESPAEDELLKKVESLYKNEKPVSPKTSFYRSQELVKALRTSKAADTSNFTLFLQQLEDYFNNLKKHNLNDKVIYNQQHQKNNLLSFLILLIGFPFFLYGLINNALAAFIPVFLAKKFSPDISYNTTVKALAGLITFAIFWSLQTWLLHQYVGNGWLTLIYFLSLYPTGVLAWEYGLRFKQILRKLRFNRLTKNQQQALLEQRQVAWKWVKDLV